MYDHWITLIDSHVRRHKTGDALLWAKVQRFFMGQPWADTPKGESEAELIKTSTNFVFPIVETATSVLIPPNPQVSAEPMGPVSPESLRIAEAVVNHSLRFGGYRDELQVAVSNVVKFGRCPLKTTWDVDTDLPVTRVVDPRNYFYDRTAKRFSDVKYEIEGTLLSRREMTQRVEAGMYDKVVLKSPDRYPQWLLPDTKREIDDLKNYQPWFLVWEVYDREGGEVLHFLPGNRDPILVDKLVYRPYELLTFNFNGEDVGGISEIGLILPNAEEYNWTETFLLNILRFGVPGVLYDAAVASADTTVKLTSAPLGSYFPLNVPPNKSIVECFAPRPMPVYPPLANDMLAKKRDGISFVSALSDATRGQTVGAKTATELAFIEGNTKNRLRPRQSKVDSLTERISEKHLLLASRYMSKSKVARLTGSTEWTEISPYDLEGVASRFKMVPYSPMESNKAVKLEQLRMLPPSIVDSPYVKKGQLIRQVFEWMEIPDMVYTDAEVAENAAQMQQAPQPPAAAPSPGAPAGAAPAPVTPGAGDQPSDLPPRAAGFSDTVSQG